MIEELVITDLTRMSGGFVCVAGCAENGQCIRLDVPRMHSVNLGAGGRPVVFPSAVVACDVLENRPDPPHTEDHAYNLYSLRLLRRLDAAAWQATLERLLYPSVAAIFEQPITHDAGYYIPNGSGPRSIGTVRPRGIARLDYSGGDEAAWGYRLGFFDQAGEFYRIKVTDLTWNAYCESLRGPKREPAAIAQELTHMLKTHRVYLRIGLSRKWAKNPDKCYLQINGLYTFPDYLAGLTFADLMPSLLQ